MAESKDPLGDRMKSYEQKEAGQKLLPLLPVCARIDGRSFSSWTKGLKRPYDERLSKVMIEVTKYLVQETKALIGYTQSDEISLVWFQPTTETKMFFDGKIQKLASVLASMAAARFAVLAPAAIPEKATAPASFDCRVWSVPNKTEAVNTLLWREFDAVKNSVSMAAQAHYTQPQLNGKGSDEQRAMLLAKGVDWHSFPTFFKRGTYVQRRGYERSLTDDELAKIPEKNRPAPGTTFTRFSVVEIDMPPLSTVLNREAVVFEAAQPLESAVA